MPRQRDQTPKLQPIRLQREQCVMTLRTRLNARLSEAKLNALNTMIPLLQRSLLHRSLLLRADMDMAKNDYSLGKFLTHCTIILWLVFILMNLRAGQKFPLFSTNLKGAAAPLAMEGGDPYIRALMRTISASESNVENPYSVIYGGSRAENLAQHPDRCITIPVGPNTGLCSTAAGRYQFITTTWQEQAKKYHPGAEGLWLWQHYSFEPAYQDMVLYRWLSDARAWGNDLPTLLKTGQVNTVLRLLSPTWTSLGYGIETNDMSAALPQIYQEVLQQELAATVPNLNPKAMLELGASR
jgi:muramidase (phage lysozyme)